MGVKEAAGERGDGGDRAGTGAGGGLLYVPFYFQAYFGGATVRIVYARCEWSFEQTWSQVYVHALTLLVYGARGSAIAGIHTAPGILRWAG